MRLAQWSPARHFSKLFQPNEPMALQFNLRQKQTALWVGVGIAFFILLVLLGPVLTPFIAGCILAYALNPVVNWLRSLRFFGRFRMPRALAVLLVMGVLLAAMAALLFIIVPLLQKELPLLQEQIPVFFIRVNEALSPILQEIGVDVRLDGTGLKRLVSEHVTTSRESFWRSVLASARVGGTAVLGWLLNLVLIPVVLFYLLLDWPLLVRKTKNIVPRRWASRVFGMVGEVNAMLAQYLRGQLLVMLVLSAYYSGALALADYNVALPVGLITGLLAFVPYVGYCIGLILAAIATMLQFGTLQSFMILAMIYGVGTILEGFFLTPKLVGDRIQLHPVMVIFALLAFAQLFGFVGVLLALPSSAILSVAFRHLRIHYINSQFYNS